MRIILADLIKFEAESNWWW